MPRRPTRSLLALAAIVALTPGAAAGQQDEPSPYLSVYTEVASDRTVTLTADGYLPDTFGSLAVSIDQRPDEDCPQTAAELPDEGYWVIGSDTEPFTVGPDEWDLSETFRPGPAVAGWWRVCAYVSYDGADPATPDTLVAADTYVVPATSAGRGPVFITCWDRRRSTAGTDVYRATRRPRTCTHFGPGGAFAGGVNLARIRWIAPRGVV